MASQVAPLSPSVSSPQQSAQTTKWSWEKVSLKTKLSATARAAMEGVALIGGLAIACTYPQLTRGIALGVGASVLAVKVYRQWNQKPLENPAAAVRASIDAETPTSVEEYTTKDSVADSEEIEYQVRVEHFKAGHVVKRSSQYESTESTYNIKWELQSTTYDSPVEAKKVFMKRIHNKIFVTQIQPEETIKLEFKLPNPDRPWIQQPNGFRPFIYGYSSEVKFYAIDPLGLTLRAYKAAKSEIIEDPEFGVSQKIEVHADRGMSIDTAMLPLAESWHSPKTAEQHRMSYEFTDEVYGESRLVKA